MAQIIWECYESEQKSIYLLFLSYIIDSVEHSSQTLQFVSERPRVERLFSLATLSDDRRTCDYAMDALYELCSHCDDEDDSETSMVARVLPYVIEHADDLAGFVGNRQMFGHAKARAIELLAAVISAQETVPDSILQAAGSLFQQTLEEPLWSRLHVGMVSLFRIIGEGEDPDWEALDGKFQIRKAIVEEFAGKSKDKLFYCHLMEVAKWFVESGAEGTPEWREFVEGTYPVQKKLMSGKYGGPHPVKGSKRLVYGSDDEIPTKQDEQKDT
jgi:hypothetical protein